MQFCPNCGRKLDDDATFAVNVVLILKIINLQQLNHQIMRF